MFSGPENTGTLTMMIACAFECKLQMVSAKCAESQVQAFTHCGIISIIALSKHKILKNHLRLGYVSLNSSASVPTNRVKPL